ncbi:MAG: RNA polymerase sigma factor [Clostridiales bacterium]|nr:RNA polymerase sigma factor [Clostridiales bacterium]
MIESLYSKYYSELLNYCTSLSHDPALSEDVVQECFLRALSNLDVLNELSEPQCRAWLYRTVKNIFIDHVRRLAKQPLPDEEHFSEDDYSRLAVELMCCHLPEDERSLFLLRYIEGYNSTELGEMFDLSPSTVRARLASARSRLRKILTQNE